MIVLRWSYPGLDRPFRVPGYPWVPILFLIATSALTVTVALSEPTISALSALSIALGLPVFLIFNRQRTRSSLGVAAPPDL